MFTKREKILSMILALILAALVMAATIKPTSASAVIWGHVQMENLPWSGDAKLDQGTCGGRNYYVSPCPDCAVWLEWSGSPPNEFDRTHYALRIEGTVYDDNLYGCQVMLVQTYAVCPGAP